MKGQIYIFGLILFTLWGCERRVVEQGGIIESPYKLTGEINGESYEVSLKPNEFKLAPTFSRSDFGVYQFIADFDNSSAQENIKICFNDDSQEWNNKTVFADEVLFEGTKEFQTGEVDLTHNIIEVKAEEAEGVTYNWTFNEDPHAETGALVESYEVANGSDLSIFLKLLEEGITVDSLELNVDQMFSPTEPIEYNFFSVEKESNGQDQVESLICRYDGDLNRVEQITWSGQKPDGTSLASVVGNNVAYSNLQTGVYNISMNVDLVNGISFKYSQHVVNSTTDEKVANIQFRTKPDDEQQIEEMLSGVVISFERDGKTYTSISGLNDASSSNAELEIIEIGNLITNNVGQSAQEIVVNFSCDMRNVADDEDILEFRDFQGTIVVAFPTPVE